MKLHHILLLITTALAAPALRADTHLTQIRDRAVKLNNDFKAVDRELRSKQFNLATVTGKVDLIDEDINQLKRLSSSFEASNPKLNPTAVKEWQSIKETIALLDIFHDRKAEMLKGDVGKVRGQIRAQSQNLSIRALHLEKTSAQLLRSMSSGS
jgi:hypothetical protein